jgi:hypothetical protein
MSGTKRTPKPFVSRAGGKVGSYAGGRKPGSKLGTPQHILDKDRDKKRLLRANKAGFETVAEHRASIEAKEAARQANQFEFVEGPGGGYRPRVYNPPSQPMVQVQPAVVDEWPDFHAEAAKHYEPPAPPTPVVVEGRQPKKYNILTKTWEVITSTEELETIAGRRELDRNAFRGDPRLPDQNAANPVMGTWDFVQGALDAKRRERMDQANLDRYW